MKLKKIMFVISGIVVAAVVIVYFSFFYPPVSEESLTGTIGGVEKAERYRGEQPQAEDLTIDTSSVNRFIQSAEWQNLRRDENFRKCVQSGEFQRFLVMNQEAQQFIPMARDFQRALCQKIRFIHNAQDYQNWVNSEEFQQIHSQPFKQLVTSQEFQNVIISQDFQKWFNGEFSPWLDNAFQQFYTSSEIQKFKEGSTPPRCYGNVDFQKHWANNVVIWFIPCWKSIYSQEFQVVIWSQEFQKVILSQDVQAFFQSHDYQQQFMSQDFQQQFMSQDFQKQFMSQDFQKQFMSQDFQNLILNLDINRLGLVFSQDIQKFGLTAEQ